MRVLDNLTSEQIADLKERPFVYAYKIEQKIKQLQEQHQMKKFRELLDLSKVFLEEYFQLPKLISPLKTVTGITKSLYTEE